MRSHRQARWAGVPVAAAMLARCAALVGSTGASWSRERTAFWAAVTAAQELMSGETAPAETSPPSHFLNSGSPASAPAQEPS